MADSGRDESRALHVHLDPVGGIAGDMFIAAVLDAFPALTDELLDTVRAAGFPAHLPLGVHRHTDDVLCGLRFDAGESCASSTSDHGHRRYYEIRDLFLSAAIPGPVRARATAMLDLLAEAEAHAHGVELRDVTFHELGSWDSIADLVGSAYLQATLQATWSIGPLPLGGGRVPSAHGSLPVPAPATAWLLRGMVCVQDGIIGERVTPTGAVIARSLCVDAADSTLPRRLITTGTGFGTRRLGTISNVLRVMAFDAAENMPTNDQVTEILFEVDDQSLEDLAIGLEHLRALPAVRDVLQVAAVGKKGRMCVQVRVLADPAGLTQVTQACLEQTTSIGLRYHLMDRVVLSRKQVSIEIDGRSLDVKIVERPGQATCKVESESLARVPGGQAGREEYRCRAIKRLRRAENQDD